MKRVLGVLFLLCIGVGVSQAGPTLYFSTGDAADTSWTAYETAPGSSVYEMSFANIVVDETIPSGANLIGDTIVLPTMAISDLAYSTIVIGGMPMKTVTATLVPIVDPSRGLDGRIYIVDGTSPTDVMMEADLGGGGMLSISTNYMAYSNAQNDLSNIGYGSSGYAGYSFIIDSFVDAAEDGMSVDLSFSGDSASGLYNLLKGVSSTPVHGTISGQVSAIPAPGAVLLSSLGTGLVGLLRRKRSL